MLDSRDIVIQLRPPKSDVPDFYLNCSPNSTVRQLRERIIEAVKEHDPLMKITSDNVQLSASGEVLMAASLLPNGNRSDPTQKPINLVAYKVIFYHNSHMIA